MSVLCFLKICTLGEWVHLRVTKVVPLTKNGGKHGPCFPPFLVRGTTFVTLSRLS